MKKKLILIILIVLAIVSIISLYNTFAYDEEAAKLDPTDADYNLVYSLKEKSNQSIIVNAKEEKYVDITLDNTYNSTIKYGMYYYLNTPNKLPNGVTISLSDESAYALEGTIKPHENKTISIRINNASDYNIDITIGAIIGFENGNLTDLIKNGEVLIK